MALIAVTWLFYAALRFCVVRPARRHYRQRQQRAALRAEVSRIQHQAAAAALRLEAAATQAHADMARRARGR
ncbi:hypothetical protein [Rhodococcus chondri]|uniref:Uncharacterized protein n=1 Tax=Rhodococcus chondri TaxID=3065941 RepID=A0ABU7JSG1_9NOCA|nr:hypothetical protein [Rhodococcus sp. CC-R104]MEE2032975.1 hypothetical protein [Rhodococcus sp. CC-R104]